MDHSAVVTEASTNKFIYPGENSKRKSSRGKILEDAQTHLRRMPEAEILLLRLPEEGLMPRFPREDAVERS